MHQIKCPKCKSSKIIYFLYGYPAEPPELLQEELGYYKVILMGCMPPTNDKEYYDHKCSDCKHTWIEESLHDDEDVLVE